MAVAVGKLQLHVAFFGLGTQLCGKNYKEADKQCRWIDRQIKSKRWVKGSDGGRMKRKKVIEREEKRVGKLDNEA